MKLKILSSFSLTCVIFYLRFDIYFELSVEQ